MQPIENALPGFSFSILRSCDGAC